MYCELTPCPPFMPNIGLFVDCLSACVKKENPTTRETVEHVVEGIAERLRPLGDPLGSADERTALAWFYTSLQRDVLESRHASDSTFRPLLGLAQTTEGIRLYLRSVWWVATPVAPVSEGATWLLDPYTFKFKEAGVRQLSGKLDHLKEDESLAFLCRNFPHHIPVFDGVNGLALGFLPKLVGPVACESDMQRLREGMLALRHETGLDREVITLILDKLLLHVGSVVPKGEFKAVNVLSIVLSRGEQPMLTSTGTAPLSLLVNRFGLLRNLSLHLEKPDNVTTCRYPESRRHPDRSCS